MGIGWGHPLSSFLYLSDAAIADRFIFEWTATQIFELYKRLKVFVSKKQNCSLLTNTFQPLAALTAIYPCCTFCFLNSLGVQPYLALKTVAK